MNMEKKWTELTPDEKRQERFQKWLSPPGVRFKSPAAAQGYKERVTRFIQAINLEKPDRVPCLLPAGFFPAYYAGKTLQTVIYDYDELRLAWLKFLHEFEMDAFQGPGNVLPGEVFDQLDFKLYKWPGHGLSAEVSSYQFAEGEYMQADEYDALIQDPSDFWTRIYLPRIFGALNPLRKLTPVTSISEIPVEYFMSYALPEVQDAMLAFVKAGQQIKRWQETVSQIGLIALEEGYPSLWSGFAKAPFDTLGDTLRGTQGIMIDMYRHPDKLIEAMERLTPLTIKSSVASAQDSGTPLVIMPLHKGADGFMSGKQYKTLYWPTLRKVIMGLIDEGLVPVLFAEGSYNRRLEMIKDLPTGKVVWYFDQTDMAKAKEILGKTACLAGNVPTSLLCTGTPQTIKDYCRHLIETCGQGGGFILTGGSTVDECNPDNLRALMDAVKEFIV